MDKIKFRTNGSTLVCEVESFDELDEITDRYNRTEDRKERGELSRLFSETAKALNNLFGRQVYNTTIKSVQ